MLLFCDILRLAFVYDFVEREKTTAVTEYSSEPSFAVEHSGPDTRLGRFCPPRNTSQGQASSCRYVLSQFLGHGQLIIYKRLRFKRPWTTIRTIPRLKKALASVYSSKKDHAAALCCDSGSAGISTTLTQILVQDQIPASSTIHLRF